MATNIEIKARLRDPDRTTRLAEDLAGAPPEVIEQEDTFFRTPAGRLKMRVFASGEGELIHYERPDSEGPKASHYRIFRTAEPERLRTLLEAALGIRGIVRKSRRLYLTGQTRIHLDRVEGLGEFVELEVVLEEGQDPAEGVRIAEEMMGRLGIGDADLVEGAYIDLMDGNG
ncbi:MAG TPA: class IV adenylate cyclase [Anaerolineales bacterium]|nr:class IV adenylate cyclase [Anaerolineales bacterium]